MQLELGLAVPSTSACADVLVRAPEGTALGDVTGALLARVLPPGTAARLTLDGQELEPTALLGSPPLVQGALLSVGGPPPAPGVVLGELHVLAGPDAGRVHRLACGEVVVGRDGAAAVPVQDDQVSRAHCLLRVSPHGVSVRDLGSANGTTLAGQPVGSAAVALPIGAQLCIGRSTLALAEPAPAGLPVAPAPDGRCTFSRPPRLRAPREVVRVEMPSPPSEVERAPLPVLAVLAPLLLGIAMWRFTGSTAFLLFSLLSPVLVLGSSFTERRAGSRRSRRALAQWRAAREVAESTLAAAVRADELTRRAEHPDPAQALLTARGPGARLWERRRGDGDLLDLRLGLADQPARVEATGDLAAGSTAAQEVPLVVPLREVGVLGIAGSRAARQALGRWLVVQAAVAHAPQDLQVVVLAEPAAAGAWEWARWLPHVRPTAGQACRALLGLDARQVAARVAELRALVEARAADDAGGRQQVLIVVDGARSLRGAPGLAQVLADGPRLGVTAICLEIDRALLPQECGATAEVHDDGRVQATIAGRPALPRGSADLVSPHWAEAAARALAPLRVDDGEGDGSSLPERLRWTELVGLPLAGGDADATAVVARWQVDRRSTRALLGCGPDGPLAVDLASDGPHALIAGTTGSGKSELLQTLIASLALANRPDELTFVLVDYKGGAAFGPCSGLPHVVGLVTDLDGALVERALASLRAELSRREAVLARVGAKDLEEHRRRAATREALPRLVIVVDEFASLAEDLPDFVGGLVGIAMRGRSLGVHLVLATQRPEGVVSADIRANTNLRLCLAVTRDSESRDVIDSPLAARIPRTRPGRGYARTGHGELAPFQAARVGGRRPARQARRTEPTVELLPACELGDPPPTAPTGPVDDDASDLALLVRACAAAASRLGLGEQRSPWLPPLPASVLLHELTAPASGQPSARLAPLPYAVVDVPEQQSRRVLAYDLETATHLMVVGAPRSGRTTALRTLAGAVCSTASPDDVHLYVVDFGGGLAPLAALPHTGAVVGRNQPRRLDRLLTWLSEELSRRQEVLAAGGCTDLAEQRAGVAAADRLPHLLVLLDRWEAFLADVQDLDAGRLVELAHRLLREGGSVGVHVVLSGDRSALVGRLPSLVEQTLLLRLADPSDYGLAGLPARLVPPELPPGRGWAMLRPPLVTQVALLDADAGGAAQAAALAHLAAGAPGPVHSRPRRFEELPAAVRLADLAPSADRRRLLLGVGGDQLERVEVDPAAAQPGLLVAGPPGSGRSTALVLLAEQLLAAGTAVVAVTPRPSWLRGHAGLSACVTDRDAAQQLEAALDRGPGALLVDDAELLVDSPLAPGLERAVRGARDTGLVVVAAGSTDDLLLAYRGFVVDLRRSRTGVLLSPRSAADGDLLTARLSRATGGPVRPGRALLVAAGGVTALQVALPTTEDWSERAMSSAAAAAEDPGSPSSRRRQGLPA